MVYYFTTNVVEPPYSIYMGEDKYENEALLKYAWPEDIWFHVSKLSSAHVYLRLEKNQTIDDIPSAVIEDCIQLVKANSIEGNKINNVDVVYTPVSNLKKTAGMDVGQVGFHKDKDVKTVRVEKRINDIVNRLNKTKIERKPDLQAEREERDRKEREDKKKALREQKELEKEEEKRKRELNELKSYSSLMSTEKMNSNKDGNDSDEFM